MWRHGVIWIFVLGLLLPVRALETRSGGTVTIPAGTTINDDLVVSGGEVTMAGYVTGDLVVSGGNVRVTGPVDGNLILASGDATVTAPVGGTVYAATGTLRTSSVVRRNLVVAAGRYTAAPSTRVGRDLVVSSGNATIAATVGRDVKANAERLTIADQARIGGDLIATAGTTRIADAAVIDGQRRVTQQREREGRGWPILWWFLWPILATIAGLLVALPFVAIAPRLTEDAIIMLRRHPWGSLLAGFIIVVVVPLAVLILFMTVVGIPLGLIVLAAYLAALLLSPFITAIWFARLLRRGRSSGLYLDLLIGAGVLVVVQWIPLLGGLVMFVAALFGLGALYLGAQARSAHPLFGRTAA